MSERVKASELVKSLKPRAPGEIESHLRKSIRDLTRANSHLREKLGDRKELANSIAAAVTSEPALPRCHVSRSSKLKPRVWAVLKLSDWHIGEVVEANETEGFNEFSWAIAQARIYRIAQDFIKWVETQRNAYIIDDCAILGEGDYISGDIHLELQVTNEFPLPVQTAKAGLLLGEVLRIVASHFKQVHVKLVGADNHGRLVRKPQAKQKTSNSMSFLVHTIAQARCDRCSNIDFEIAEGMKLHTEINGAKFLIEHGDTVKGWAGLPFYGFQRSIGKEAARRMNSDLGFHYWSTAHFHTPFFMENRHIGNGSLSGTSEFDHSQGRHSAPCQVAFLVHPEHRIFNIVPFTAV